MRQTETLRHDRANVLASAGVKRAAKQPPRRKKRPLAQDQSKREVCERTHPIDTAWFQRILAEKRLSQRQLAFKMDMDPGAMSLMLHGKRGMSAGEAAGMAAWINVPVEEILMRAGVSRGASPATKGQAETKVVVGRSAIGDKSEPFVVPVVGWANANTREERLSIDVGFVDKRPSERSFRMELDREIAAMKTFLGL